MSSLLLFELDHNLGGVSSHGSLFLLSLSELVESSVSTFLGLFLIGDMSHGIDVLGLNLSSILSNKARDEHRPTIGIRTNNDRASLAVVI